MVIKDNDPVILPRATLFGYIWKESVKTCLLALTVLLAITVVLFLAELLGDVADGEVASSTVIRLLLLRLPEALALVGPLALLVGLTMSLGEIAQMQEFVVMRIGGLRPGSMLGVVLSIAVVWALGLLLVSGWISPHAERQTVAIAESIAGDLVMAGVHPGQFKPFQSGILTLYVESAEARGAKLGGIFMHHQGDGQFEVVTARTGTLGIDPQTGERRVSLFDGVHITHAGSENGLPLRRIEFERNDIQLPAMARAGQTDSLAQATLPELIAADGRAAGVELQWRLAPAIVSLVSVLFVLPVTLTGSGGGRFGIVLVTLVGYLIYANMINLALVRLQVSDLPATIGIWPMHALVLGVAAVLALRWWRKW